LIELSDIPKDKSMAYRLRGKMYLQLKQSDQAIAQYSEGMRVDPKDYINYRQRAQVYETQKQYKKAIADFTTAIDLNRINSDDLATSYSGRARCYDKIGKTDLVAADRKVVKKAVDFFEDN